ncbi:MAG TPA: response regulator transcription factor [Longimicrobiales bacterium]|nr:response regulator transcription factor [Longimicrobiales bacterium]
MTEVVVAVGEPLVRLGLLAALGDDERIGAVRVAEDPASIEPALAASPEAVVVLDVAWRRADPDLLPSIVERFPRARVLVYVAHTAEECVVRALLVAGDRLHLSPDAVCKVDECCLTSLRHHAHGCLPSEATPEQVVRAVTGVVRDEVVAAPWLSAVGASSMDHAGAADTRAITPRELEVMSLLAHGLGNKGIARRLGIKEQTVKNHLARIMTKMGVRNRVQVGLVAQRYGLEHAGAGTARWPVPNGADGGAE